MKFGELRDRDIINVKTGEKLGTFGNCDLDIDEKTGQIRAIHIESGLNLFSLFTKNEEAIIIPWEKIVKIGKDTIMVSI